MSNFDTLACIWGASGILGFVIAIAWTYWGDTVQIDRDKRDLQG